MLNVFVLPQPYPWLIAIALVLGFFAIGRRLSYKYLNSGLGALDSVASYLLVLNLTAVFVSLVLWELLPMQMLYGISFFIAAIGIWDVRKIFTALFKYVHKLWKSRSNAFEGACLILVWALIAGFFLAAILPPTDADSLDYHLGVPLAWLSLGGFDSLDYWYHARLVGLGENLIFFGLYNGSDVFSALLQFSGAVSVAVALHSVAVKRLGDVTAFVFSSLLVFSSPVMLFLVPNQKPYLIAVGMVVVSAALLIKVREQATFKKTLLTAFFLLTSSVLYKYTFLVSLFALFIFALFIAYKNGFLKMALITLVFLGGLILLPEYIKKWYFYGDPLSPIFSRYLIESPLSLIHFAQYLKQGYSPGLWSLLNIPFDQGIFTLSPSRLSTVVGVGGVFILASIFSKDSHVRSLMVVFAVGFLLVALLGRPIARYMMELYFIAAMALLLTELPVVRLHAANVFLFAQGMVVFLSLMYFISVSITGLTSNSSKFEVMRNSADGFVISEISSAHIPVGEAFLTNVRSKALMPIGALLSDAFDYGMSANEFDEFFKAQDEVQPVRYAVIELPFPENMYSLKECYEPLHSFLYKVPVATRNPLNRKSKDVLIFEIDKSLPLCSL